MTVNSAWNIQNFRRAILTILLKRGESVTVLAPKDRSIAFIEGIGARFVPLKMDNKGVNPIRDATLILHLFRQFRAQRPDVILSWTIKNNIYGALAARWAKVPFIPNVSGLGTAFLTDGLLQQLVRALYRLAFRPLDTVFFQNPDDRDMFLHHGLVTPEQAQCLPGSGIDLERFTATPLPEGPPVFLMVARLLRDKGVLEYVEAARRIKATYPDAVFRLLGAAGADNRTAISRENAQAWHDAGTIEYLGTADDVRPHLARASCIVLPSYYPEGTPRSLLEGSAMARPIITTNMPGCRSVVEHGRTGLLCEARNPESLAVACERFLTMSAAEKTAMGRAGRTKMEAEFDERLVVKAYMKAIDRALARQMKH